MRRALALGALVATALAVPAVARAQAGVEIGGTVDSLLGLTVIDDGPTTFHTQITSTTGETRLSAAGSPGLEVEAAVGTAFQPLGVPIDPLLTRWTRPLASEPVTLVVRGHATKPDPYISITVSAATP
jgi:hypothetical protein